MAAPAPAPAKAKDDSDYGFRFGLLALGLTNPETKRWSGFAGLSFDFGPRWTTLLGVHIAPVPSGRFVLERRLFQLGFLDTRLALRINGTPVDGAIAYGGGAGLVLRLPLSKRLDLQGGAAADLMLLDGEKKFLPYMEVGVRAHF